MAACNHCKKDIRWSDTFPGGICVDCHKDLGKLANKVYEDNVKLPEGGKA